MTDDQIASVIARRDAAAREIGRQRMNSRLKRMTKAQKAERAARQAAFTARYGKE
jgi:hypothetical protein